MATNTRAMLSTDHHIFTTKGIVHVQERPRGNTLEAGV